MDNNSIEKGILAKSHDEETAARLLSERYSLGGDQKPFLNLTSTQVVVPPAKATPADTLKPQRRLARRELTAWVRSHRRKGSIQYDSFAQLNDMWNKYIADLLAHSSGAPVTGKLASGDYHGAELSVSRACNPTLVGVHGICVWESKSGFVLCTRQNRLQIIQKQGTTFRVHANALAETYEILGSRFTYRTAERSGRKFKPKAVKDLL